MANGSVNKVILIGNLGRDPEIRYLPSGGAVANLAVATSEKWRDKQVKIAKNRMASCRFVWKACRYRQWLFV